MTPEAIHSGVLEPPEAVEAYAPVPFQPRRWLRNGHLQTIVGNVLPRRHGTLPQATAELVEIIPARPAQISTQLLCECHWQPAGERANRPTAILVHGLEGSSRSQYMLGNAAKLWSAGCNVIRMNMRTCGGTDQLAPTLYHSGLSGDVLAVLEHFVQREGLRSVALIGYSMGGNLVLKLAGDLGAAAPPELRAVIGVSPVMNLAATADALHEPANRFYEHRFLRSLLKRYRNKAHLFPRAFDPQRAMQAHSLREFDDRITALYCGFRSADDYYARAAAARVLHRIVVPTLVLHACDDPFIRLLPETRVALEANPALTLVETGHGGHCAFLAEPEPANGYDGYWAERTALGFVLKYA